MRRGVSRATAFDQLIGTSPPHLAMREQLRLIAASEAPALIEGETGSGKELAARAIHYGGARSAGPFVPVNCGALPDSLIESELFGVERGAFTDARQSRTGLVAEAAQGTLFLDEVDALSPKAQVTLLRFLQDQCYRPVGTVRELRTDVRVLAASNRPLHMLVDTQSFRVDLLYRLKILHLSLPPLRERGADVEILAQHFIERFAAQYGIAPKGLPAHTSEWLRQYPWPGNVRELENWVHRAMLMTPGPLIDACGAAPAVATPGGIDAPLRGFQQAKAEAVRLFEREYLMRALDESCGNVSRAARLAGKERRAFGKLMKKHGLARDDRSQ
jgi:two-component system, NtrC family, response regulator GlrR